MKEIKTDSSIVRIYSPEITKEKAARQTKRMKKAAEKMMLQKIINKVN